MNTNEYSYERVNPFQELHNVYKYHVYDHKCVKLISKVIYFEYNKLKIPLSKSIS